MAWFESRFARRLLSPPGRAIAIALVTFVLTSTLVGYASGSSPSTVECLLDSYAAARDRLLEIKAAILVAPANSGYYPCFSAVVGEIEPAVSKGDSLAARAEEALSRGDVEAAVKLAVYAINALADAYFDTMSCVVEAEGRNGTVVVEATVARLESRLERLELAAEAAAASGANVSAAMSALHKAASSLRLARNALHKGNVGDVGWLIDRASALLDEAAAAIASASSLRADERAKDFCAKRDCSQMVLNLTMMTDRVREAIARRCAWFANSSATSANVDAEQVRLTVTLYPFEDGWADVIVVAEIPETAFVVLPLLGEEQSFIVATDGGAPLRFTVEDDVILVEAMGAREVVVSYQASGLVTVYDGVVVVSSVVDSASEVVVSLPANSTIVEIVPLALDVSVEGDDLILRFHSRWARVAYVPGRRLFSGATMAGAREEAAPESDADGESPASPQPSPGGGKALEIYPVRSRPLQVFTLAVLVSTLVAAAAWSLLYRRR